AAEAANAKGCTAWPPGSAGLEVGGGCAIFAGVGSPPSQAVGIGLNGPVSAADLDRLADFFHSRGAPVSIDLCPLADPGLLPALGMRGYRPTEFGNVLVKRLAAAEIVLTPRVRRGPPGGGGVLRPHPG